MTRTAALELSQLVADRFVGLPVRCILPKFAPVFRNPRVVRLSDFYIFPKRLPTNTRRKISAHLSRELEDTIVVSGEVGIVLVFRVRGARVRERGNVSLQRMGICFSDFVRCWIFLDRGRVGLNIPRQKPWSKMNAVREIEDGGDAE